MNLRSWDYHLPEDLIAQRPLDNREDSRLLVLDRETGRIRHERFADCLQYFRPGDLLVLNDTRVTARRLHGNRASGGPAEFLVLGRLKEDFEALARPAKRLRVGDELALESGLHATILENLGGGRKRIRLDHPSADPAQVLATAGQIPLPPYIREKLSEEARYQTVFAATPGSAAAPTAALHFTHRILAEFRAKGVNVGFVTLDVGIDTFRPVLAENPLDHEIHGEICQVSPQLANDVNNRSGRVFAVGTTTVRTLETFVGQSGRLEPGRRLSKLFITPGFEFQLVEGIFTNFHLPKTTMLLMIAAFAGDANLAEAYREAVENRYRFLSFGDSMLVLQERI